MATRTRRHWRGRALFPQRPRRGRVDQGAAAKRPDAIAGMACGEKWDSRRVTNSPRSPSRSSDSATTMLSSHLSCSYLIKGSLASSANGMPRSPLCNMPCCNSHLPCLFFSAVPNLLNRGTNPHQPCKSRLIVTVNTRPNRIKNLTRVWFEEPA
jgi:hypothetical protein